MLGQLNSLNLPVIVLFIIHWKSVCDIKIDISSQLNMYPHVAVIPILTS